MNSKLDLDFTQVVLNVHSIAILFNDRIIYASSRIFFTFVSEIILSWNSMKNYALENKYISGLIYGSVENLLFGFSFYSPSFARPIHTHSHMGPSILSILSSELVEYAVRKKMKRRTLDGQFIFEVFPCLRALILHLI
ncbi:hypothetical protein DERF_005982 [Dermatophagoides farinae]|uniref:Uncharacterized protein n=1 Tax=Dermatophagoides farinae TaxID=6954 RepID=A0A922I829_DERFA|nr:hypothetical protein DERF_005982 [Dermatophagoides farinae]